MKRFHKNLFARTFKTIPPFFIYKRRSQYSISEYRPFLFDNQYLMLNYSSCTIEALLY